MWNVRAVVERFPLDLGTADPAEVIDAFTTGKNPMRARPLIVSTSGRLMLPHPALNVIAVRENLEEHLKTSQSVWDQYSKHRGDLLESRTHDALNRVLPGARFRDAFEYYLPANAQEAETADPAKYTKRVEGDHLIVLDDVAIIVEDKAVALSTLARGGKTTRLRTDLTRIITKAAEQSGRMRDAIQRDGGLRIEDEDWSISAISARSTPSPSASTTSRPSSPRPPRWYGPACSPPTTFPGQCPCTTSS
ncbi:hypothetical protein [Streptomyces sp. NPDC021212]|uniref:hypothetical protein n=1 Tax=Streptomyces sp. NPDC021212 TaxID=3365118 RepID=UPI00379740E4